jgi:hypothetical protein
MEEQFGRWTLIGKATRRSHRKVRCICGTVREVPLYDLRSGKSKSCGCLRREINSRIHRTHGESGHGPSRRTPEYRTWAGMLNRSRNPNALDFHNYGGRGIRVCARWQRYENFLADMGRRPPGTSLERCNNNRGYSPHNCYWATHRQQMSNTRRTVLLSYAGVTQTLAAWARQLNIKPNTLKDRLRRGWPSEDAFSPKKYRTHSGLAKRKEQQ